MNLYRQRFYLIFGHINFLEQKDTLFNNFNMNFTQSQHINVDIALDCHASRKHPLI